MSIIDELELKMYRAEKNYEEAEYALRMRLDETGNCDYVVYAIRRMRDGVDDLEETYIKARNLYHMALEAAHRGIKVDRKWVKINKDVKVEVTV